MYAHVHPHARGTWLAERHQAEVRPRVLLEAEARAHGDEALPRGPLSSRLAPQVSSEAMGVEISSLTMQQYMQGKKLKKNAAEREGMEAALRKKDREAAEGAAEIRDLHATVGSRAAHDAQIPAHSVLSAPLKPLHRVCCRSRGCARRPSSASAASPSRYVYGMLEHAPLACIHMCIQLTRACTTGSCTCAGSART